MTAASDSAQAAPERTVSTRTATYVVALGAGFTSMAFNVWWPFLALYVLEIGATSDANALFWVFIGTSAQGATRLLTSPLWGILSDRMGRKMMLLRSLYFSSLTFLIAAVVQEPWQLTIALAVQGVFSGFIGPAAALVSVTVPEKDLSSSLSKVNAAQYMGTTLGPMLGALLGLITGSRETILIASILPLIGAIAVHVIVPRDQVQVRQKGKDGKQEKLEPFRWTFQFSLVILLYLVLFAVIQLVRFVIPLDLKSITDADVKAVSGVMFTAGGAASAISILVLSPLLFKAGRIAAMLGVTFLVIALSLVLMAFAGTPLLYGLGFVLVAGLLSAMVPISNTLVAGNVSRARRGTAFGIASSAQAIALFVGPGGSALFGAISYDAGFVVLGGIMLAIGLVLFAFIREPKPQE